MKKKVFYLLLSWFLPFAQFAQLIEMPANMEEYIADILEHYMAEAEVELDIDSYLEELMYLYEEPLDLNQVEREDLQQLVFLSDIQIENLMYYRYKAGEFLTIYELMLVEDLDMTDIRRILPFVVVSEKKKAEEKFDLKRALKYGKNEVLTRIDFIPEKKKGYIKNEDGESPYIGDRFYNHLKYRFKYKDQIYFNITGEKDAGEQFWGNHNKLYDFWSASLQMKNIGRLKNLIIGDYQANFGQGLVISQAFKTGKSAMATHICDMNAGFKRYGSNNEFNYLRGIASTIQLTKFQLSAYYSYDKKDGNREENEITGFYQTGYHRTITEISKKNVITQQLLGCNLTYQDKWFKLGISLLYLFLDKPLQPKLASYNLFYFTGKKQWINSLDYRFRVKKFAVFGEIGKVDWQHTAWVSGATYAPISRVNLAILYRYYPPEYNAFYANSFAESSASRNESGLYIGAEIQPIKNVKLSCYADNFRFPWLRYGVDAPSFGKDFLMQVQYTPFRQFQLNARVKYKQNHPTKKIDEEALLQKYQYDKTAVRLQCNHETGIFRFRQQLDANWLKRESETTTFGFAALQEISLDFNTIPLRLDFSYLFFDAADYENRVYVFERDVLYAFSINALSGVGSRYYINLRYDISKKLSCWLKFSQIVYTDDRDEIGSGNEVILGNRKSEIKWLMRYKL